MGSTFVEPLPSMNASGFQFPCNLVLIPVSRMGPPCRHKLSKEVRETEPAGSVGTDDVSVAAGCALETKLLCVSQPKLAWEM